MDFDWKSVVKTVAPALATALGGPLAGVAVSTIAGALLGKPSASEAEIAEAVQFGGADALLALRKADQDFAAKMRELDISEFRVAVEDRASARMREIQANDSTTPRVIAAVVISGWFFVQCVLLFSVIPAEMREIIMRTLGTLDAVLLGIIAFYFGSSYGSAEKQRTIERIAERKP